MKKSILYLFSLAMLGTGVISCSSNTDSKDVAKDENADKFDSTNLKKDAVFAVNIADANMTEIKLGQLAQTYATTAAAKDLGTMMVDDHTKAEAELKAIADSDNISLPDSIATIQLKNTMTLQLSAVWISTKRLPV